MVGYPVLESAIVTAINTQFDSEFDGLSSGCVAGKFDELYDNMSKISAKYGCLLEFAGGRLSRDNPFNQPMWSWFITGVFLIRYTDNAVVEDDLRTVLSKLPVVFDSDRRLGGLTPLVSITNIDTPEPIQLGDTPYYWLPFSISVYDR